MKKSYKINIFTLFLFIAILINLQSNYTFATENIYSPNGYKIAAHQHSESSYQHAWCSQHKGIEEYENKDKTRVDCLTDTHAVEFDFANKWAESIGQALHYQLMTGKRAKVVLILENPKKEMCYYIRVKNLANVHNFDSEYLTPKFLKIKNNKCPYYDCKCRKN